MNRSYAKNTYVNNQILTAPQNKLVLMLYDGILKDLRLAEKFIKDNNLSEVNKYLLKSQDIIMELMNTLNFDQGGEIAEGLHQLYDYMYMSLIRANIDKDLDKILEVKKLMEELRDTWAQI